MPRNVAMWPWPYVQRMLNMHAQMLCGAHHACKHAPPVVWPTMHACTPRYVTHHAQKVDVRSTCVTSGGNPALDLNHRRSLSTRETRQVGICNVWGEGGQGNVAGGEMQGHVLGAGRRAEYGSCPHRKHHHRGGPVWPWNEDQMVHGYMRQVSRPLQNLG